MNVLLQKISQIAGLSQKMMGTIKRTGVLHSFLLLIIIADKTSSFTKNEERISNQYKGIVNLDWFLTILL